MYLLIKNYQGREIFKIEFLTKSNLKFFNNLKISIKILYNSSFYFNYLSDICRNI